MKIFFCLIVVTFLIVSGGGEIRKVATATAAATVAFPHNLLSSLPKESYIKAATTTEKKISYLNILGRGLKKFVAANAIYSHKFAGHDAFVSTFVATYEYSPVIFSVGISRNP